MTRLAEAAGVCAKTQTQLQYRDSTLCEVEEEVLMSAWTDMYFLTTQYRMCAVQNVLASGMQDGRLAQYLM